ncbi:MAG: hypothetical protein AAFY47_07370 [Pseudomonadota bacterium]
MIALTFVAILVSDRDGDLRAIAQPNEKRAMTKLILIKTEKS